jgi:phage terminase large subunit GpA-like protein
MVERDGAVPDGDHGGGGRSGRSRDRVSKSSQVGGSEVLNNIIGKRIQLAPTEIIYCAEKEDKAKAWTQESFDTMVRATPTLRAAHQRPARGQ